MYAKYSGEANIPKDKGKSLKCASLQYKHGILKGRRANRNGSTGNKRHVECKENSINNDVSKAQDGVQPYTFVDNSNPHRHTYL